MADVKQKIEVAAPLARTIGIPRHGTDMPEKQRPQKRGGQAPVAVPVANGSEPVKPKQGGNDE